MPSLCEGETCSFIIQSAIGNIGNLYMNEFDHFEKRELGTYPKN